ncbi:MULTISPECIES: hypothetical protein [unclassified Methanosarcina]|uniref:hypothetical protein n=1 Tax=unclassified Methanosarcina TaxID=2644672 RepID=UPI0012E0AF63|nr:MULTISPECIES: hypothetical protein [unclassified Methanosarcina]
MINIEESYGVFGVIITSLIIPLLCIPIQAYFSSHFNKNYLPALGKIAYQNFLIINSKPIGDLYHKIEKYKQDTWKKNVWFVEGAPIGALFSMFLFISCFVISQIRGFNNFILLSPYYSYLNYGHNDKDLIMILITLNIFTLVVSMIISFYLIVFYSKGYLEPKLTKELSLKRSSKYFYYSIWFSMGIIIGFNAIVLFFTIYFDDVVIKLITSSLTGLINYFVSLCFICVYLVSIGLSCVFIIMLYNNAKLFSNLFKQKINDYYIDDFPHLRIKTNAVEISGKIDDIQNESLIILNDGSTVKAIRWDQITSMEIEKFALKEKITMGPLPENAQSKKWWRFW